MKTLARSAAFTAALLALPAVEAVERSADGYGDVLLFPYLIASDPFATVLTISNRDTSTDAQDGATAVRVALRFPTADGGAPPSPRLIDVLLADNDSWTFAVVQAAEGATLHSADASCALSADGAIGPTSATTLAAREGWIEVFEMGRITSAEVLDHLQRSDRNQACADLAALLPTLDAADWLAPPANALRGTSHVVAGASGTSFTVEPLVLRDFRDAPVSPSIAEDVPTLADVQPPQTRVTLTDGSQRISTFAQHPIDAVSAVLMSTEWELDFEIAPELGAATDLVATLPTRRWYIDDGDLLPPFAHPERSDGSVEINARVSNRDGRQPDDAVAKCTPPAPRPDALGPLIDSELVVIEFGANGLFDSARAQPLSYAAVDPLQCVTGGLFPQTLPEHFDNGRVTLQFIDGPRAPVDSADFGRLVSDEGHVFRGLPLIGTAMTTVTNTDAVPGVLASYGLEQPLVRRTDYQP